MSDTKRTRPDDPVMAQKQAIDSVIPYDEEAEAAGTPSEPATPQAPVLEREVAQELPEGAPVEVPPLATRTVPVDIQDPAVAQVIAQMQQEIAQLRQGQKAGVEEEDTGIGGYPWQYYKRREDDGPMSGWVTIGPGGAVPEGPRRGKHDSGSRQTYLAKGMKLITDCGVAPSPSDRDFVKRPGDEFITLLRNGGARYVPAGQVLALKWHLKPPVAGTIFPAYEEVRARVQLFGCDDCDFEIFFLPEDHATIRGCFTHLRQSHQFRREEAALALQAQGIEYRGARFALQAAARQAGGSGMPELAIPGLKELPD